MLLYLDLTMSMMAHRVAMSRLARVQAVSHGHPTTSGIDRSVMNYYISWGAAELPDAQQHYTEQLVRVVLEAIGIAIAGTAAAAAEKEAEAAEVITHDL